MTPSHFSQHCQDDLRRMMLADAKRMPRPDRNAWGGTHSPRHVQTYNPTPLNVAVLGALAGGDFSKREIAEMTGYSPAQCVMAARTLVQFGLIRRITINANSVKYALVQKGAVQ